MKTFEDYLKDYHAESYTGTDDDMPDAFDSWLGDLDSEDYIAYGNRAVCEALMAGFDRAAKVSKEALHDLLA